MKKKHIRELQEEIGYLRRIANSRLRLTIPDGQALLDVSFEQLCLMRRFGNFNDSDEIQYIHGPMSLQVLPE